MAEEASTMLGSPGLACHPRRVQLTDQQLEAVTKEDLVKHWKELESYVDFLESNTSVQEGELTSIRELEERARQQHLESVHREKVLVRRLATKEQEMQEYVSQITELKASQAPGATALRSALLDPAVNLLLQRLRQELNSTRARLEETQNELSAWKFTPDSNTGKRLMAKCRLLYQENEDLGRMISSGRLAKLEGELALQKSFSEEVKKSQSELDEFLQELDEDVEGMQSTIYYLQQELRKSKDTVTALQQENILLKTGGEGGNSSAAPDALAPTEDMSEEITASSEVSAPLEDLAPSKVPAPSEVSAPSEVLAPSEELAPSELLAPSEIFVPSEVLAPRELSTPTQAPTGAKMWQKEMESEESQKKVPASPTPPEQYAGEDSSDSGELILKLEEEEELEGEADSESAADKDTPLTGEAEPQLSIKHVEDPRVTLSYAEELRMSIKPAEEPQQANSKKEEVSRKRSFPKEEDSSGDDSDNVPLIKKVRRDSEISLHYEDDDEAELITGEPAGSRLSDEQA
uniref:Pre-mRNA-splicing regulator WTAP n=1 Tax=Timema douglasi TaxID=61478 RepID=A0A7R8ZC04_TIMDO|nr:unnamed protein product [Timema douglasi]